MSGAFEISAGHYQVGNDSIPNAGPRHSRKVARPYWIDATPVTWSQFEVFVAAGGYARRELWASPDCADGTGFPNSVDARCRALLAAAMTFHETLSTSPDISRHQPLTGVTWFEARAICRFFNARLAYEAEWEIAMTGTRETRQPAGGQRRESCLGTLQEWTSDPFTPRYWRSEGNRSGTVWRPESGVPCVSVRGAGPGDLYQHVSARTGAEPNQESPHRGFRRVWDSPPRDDDLHVRWRA